MIQMYFGKACKEYREEMNISQEGGEVTTNLTDSSGISLSSSRQSPIL